MFATILIIILFYVFIPIHQLLRLAFLAYSLHQFPWFYWRFRCLAVSLLSICRTSIGLAAWFVYADHVTASGWSGSASGHSRDVAVMSQTWHLSQEANKSTAPVVSVLQHVSSIFGIEPYTGMIPVVVRVLALTFGRLRRLLRPLTALCFRLHRPPAHLKLTALGPRQILH